MEILDARGLECPLPVVKTKELLKEIDKVKVLVDNEIAIENLTKFAGVRHYQIVTGDDGDGFYAIIAKEGIDEELDFNEKSGDVVVISSKTMGSNEELGVVLMKSFIFYGLIIFSAFSILSTISYIFVTVPTCNNSLRLKKSRHVPQLTISTP